MDIVIIDDHPLVRQGLTTVLTCDEEMRIAGEASTAEQGIRLVSETQPDVAIVDLRLAGSSGLDVIASCKKKVPDCKYIVFTSSGNQEDFFKAEAIGVDGYILKQAFPEELISAVRLVFQGRKYFDSAIVESILMKSCRDPFRELTSRERDVLEALSEGLRNREIAKKLFITEFTVKKHVSQILAKLELSDRTQAALLAKERSVSL